jgi:arylsulfatase A-like enzyme
MQVTRRTFLDSAAAAAFAANARRPNFLLLITDQHSPAAVSANGNRYLKTPAIDSLAAQGVSFTESYCTYPVCSPARSSIFTGRMPHETGVNENGQAIAPGIPTMGEVFREAGYRTVYGGKWHLPKPFAAPPHFDQLIGGNALGAKMDEPLAGACVDFLAQTPKQPFLLVASFMNPHDICDWIRQHPGSRTHPGAAAYPPAPANMAADPEEPEAMQFHREKGYDLMSQAVGIAKDWKRNDVREYLHAYYRLIERVDAQIGRVLAALRASAAAENTVILLTSDHGEGMGAHGWVQKAAFWEESAKVPFILSGGPVSRRGVIDADTLVSGVDVMPTLCDYAGIAAPKKTRGVSTRRPVEGSLVAREFIASELLYGDAARAGRMIRTKRYKYVVFNSGARPEQLFDLERDPGEIQNLARSKTAEPILNEHRKLLARWARTTDDAFRPAAGRAHL